MEIRPFKPEDAVPASEIIRDCFLNQNLGDFSPTIIENQISDNSPEKLLEYAKDTRYFLAVDSNTILGIGGFNNTKVRTLFVNPAFQKQGVGHRLLSMILEEARLQGLTTLSCWSTFFAEEFYKKHGFKTIKNLEIPYHDEILVFREMKIDL